MAKKVKKYHYENAKHNKFKAKPFYESLPQNTAFFHCRYGVYQAFSVAYEGIWRKIIYPVMG
jgi:hypothetical protein